MLRDWWKRLFLWRCPVCGEWISRKDAVVRAHAQSDANRFVAQMFADFEREAEPSLPAREP